MFFFFNPPQRPFSETVRGSLCLLTSSASLLHGKCQKAVGETAWGSRCYEQTPPPPAQPRNRRLGLVVVVEEKEEDTSSGFCSSRELLARGSLSFPPASAAATCLSCCRTSSNRCPRTAPWTPNTSWMPCHTCLRSSTALDPKCSVSSSLISVATSRKSRRCT